MGSCCPPLSVWWWAWGPRPQLRKISGCTTEESKDKMETSRNLCIWLSLYMNMKIFKEWWVLHTSAFSSPVTLPYTFLQPQPFIVITQMYPSSEIPHVVITWSDHSPLPSVIWHVKLFLLSSSIIPLLLIYSTNIYWAPTLCQHCIRCWDVVVVDRSELALISV